MVDVLGGVLGLGLLEGHAAVDAAKNEPVPQLGQPDEYDREQRLLWN